VVEPRNGGRAVQGLNYDGSPNGDPHYDMVLRGEGLLAFYRSTSTPQQVTVRRGATESSMPLDRPMNYPRA
jgi:hypothetical protein